MIEPPIDPKAGAVVALFKGAFSAVPWVGGLIAEVGSLYLNPLERRKQRWMVEVSNAVDQIRAEFGMVVEDLQHNERFLSFLAQTTLISLKNHQQEKQEALRAALVASVDAARYADDVAFHLLRYVDELTPSHVVLLAEVAKRVADLASLKSIELIYGEMALSLDTSVDRTVFRAFLQDLDARFLLRIGELLDFVEFADRAMYVGLVEEDIRPLEVTTLGRQFLSFIGR